MTVRLPRSRGLVSALCVLAAVSLVPLAAQAGSEISAADDSSKPFVVKIHADWCGTCTKLNPTLDALHEEVGDGARIVVLDVTSKETVAQSRVEAERLGITEFFDRYKSSTGVVGVLDGASREPVSVLKGELDVDVYVAAVKKASAGAS